MAKVKPRVKVPKTAEVDEVIEIKTLISHPMHSGRAVDGDGNLVPRKIINSFRASFNGDGLCVIPALLFLLRGLLGAKVSDFLFFHSCCIWVFICRLELFLTS